MGKILVTLDDDLIDFLRRDASHDDRKTSAQLSVILKLTRQCGGYEHLKHMVEVPRRINSSKN